MSTFLLLSADCTGCTGYRVYRLYWVQGTLKIVLLLLVSLTDNYCEELGSPVAATSYIQSHHEQFLRFHNGVKKICSRIIDMLTEDRQ